MLACLLGTWHGLEYVHLKRDHATGKHAQLSSLRCAAPPETFVHLQRH
jgi:hypothetical protein